MQFVFKHQLTHGVGVFYHILVCSSVSQPEKLEHFIVLHNNTAEKSVDLADSLNAKTPPKIKGAAIRIIYPAV